jgi:hypothetical protein
MFYAVWDSIHRQNQNGSPLVVPIHMICAGLLTMCIEMVPVIFL